jgi:DNA-binding SARP family transcriptional activator/uncharacterized damage-inducible protein DinB
MEFRVLGQVEVLQGNCSIPLGGPLQRAMLAHFLMHADEVMTVERLVDELWDETPPATAKAVVHSYISRLRKVLEPADRTGPLCHVLVTAPGGYLLTLQSDQLDLHRFERLVEQARQAKAEGRLEDAAARLCAALALWRGPALAGIGAERLRSVAHLLDERRLTVIEERIDLDLRLGRHRQLLDELQMLVAMHPFREGLVGQLMLALCGSGRRVDALNLYQTTRRTLVGELGIEPGPVLQQYQRQILTADPMVGPAVSPNARRTTRPSGGSSRCASSRLSDLHPFVQRMARRRMIGGELSVLDAGKTDGGPGGAPWEGSPPMTQLDEHGRPEPPLAGSETGILLGVLDYQRATLAWKCSGLDAAGLRATTAASSITLGGLLKHMAVLEESWFSRWLRGQEFGSPWNTADWDADPDWDWHSAAQDSPELLRALWQSAVDRSRCAVAEALADGGLEQLARRAWPDGRSPSMRWIVCHMIEEYARHNGHADFIRESVDRATGESPPVRRRWPGCEGRPR